MHVCSKCAKNTLRSIGRKGFVTVSYVLYLRQNRGFCQAKILFDHDGKNVEEFSRLQDYMLDTEKESAGYRKMKRRYVELKVILTASGINLTELDIIKE